MENSQVFVIFYSYKQDSNTGRSKKFGFVVYKDKASAEKALSQNPHVVDGKEVS